MHLASLITFAASASTLAAARLDRRTSSHSNRPVARSHPSTLDKRAPAPEPFRLFAASEGASFDSHDGVVALRKRGSDDGSDLARRAPSHGQLFRRKDSSVYQSTAIWLAETGWTGICGETITDDAFLVGLPLSVYPDASTASSSLCGEPVSVTSKSTGKTVSATVFGGSDRDEYTTFTKSAYLALGGDLDVGVLDVEFSFARTAATSTAADKEKSVATPAAKTATPVVVEAHIEPKNEPEVVEAKVEPVSQSRKEDTAAKKAAEAAKKAAAEAAKKQAAADKAAADKAAADKAAADKAAADKAAADKAAAEKTAAEQAAAEKAAAEKAAAEKAAAEKAAADKAAEQQKVADKAAAEKIAAERAAAKAAAEKEKADEAAAQAAAAKKAEEEKAKEQAAEEAKKVADTTSSGTKLAVANPGQTKKLIGFTSSNCGSSGATEDEPNGSLSFLNCGISKSDPWSGWNPPAGVTLDRITTVSIEHALASNHVWEPCRPYVSMFEQVAAETGLPPILLASFALQESTCNPSVVGGGGEAGMFQITSDKCGGRSRSDCAEPWYNARTAAKYFKGELDNNGGQFLRALGAYNGWFVNMSYKDATAAAYGGCCLCQNNLDYLYQMTNGWLLGRTGYELGSYHNLRVCGHQD